jgi:hypothetical protein
MILMVNPACLSLPRYGTRSCEQTYICLLHPSLPSKSGSSFLVGVHAGLAVRTVSRLVPIPDFEHAWWLSRMHHSGTGALGVYVEKVSTGG